MKMSSKHPTNGRNRRILSPQLSLSHTGHLHCHTLIHHLHSLWCLLHSYRCHTQDICIERHCHLHSSVLVCIALYCIVCPDKYWPLLKAHPGHLHCDRPMVIRDLCETLSQHCCWLSLQHDKLHSISQIFCGLLFNARQWECQQNSINSA